MSNEQDKFTHSKRLMRDEAAIEKQLQIAKAHGLVADKPHMYGKTHSMTCGNPKCIMCSNPRKTFKELTIQEKKMFQLKLQDESND